LLDARRINIGDDLARREIQLKFKPFAAKLLIDEQRDALNEREEIGGPPAKGARPREGEEFIDEVGEAIDLGADDRHRVCKVAFSLFFRECARHKRQVKFRTIQRIAYLMGKRRREATDGGKLLRLASANFSCALFGDVAADEEEAMRISGIGAAPVVAVGPKASEGNLHAAPRSRDQSRVEGPGAADVVAGAFDGGGDEVAALFGKQFSKRAACKALPGVADESLHFPIDGRDPILAAEDDK
jgi:hypothetical protein